MLIPRRGVLFGGAASLGLAACDSGGGSGGASVLDHAIAFGEGAGVIPIGSLDRIQSLADGSTDFFAATQSYETQALYQQLDLALEVMPYVLTGAGILFANPTLIQAGIAANQLDYQFDRIQSVIEIGSVALELFSSAPMRVGITHPNATQGGLVVPQFEVIDSGTGSVETRGKLSGAWKATEGVLSADLYVDPGAFISTGVKLLRVWLPNSDVEAISQQIGIVEPGLVSTALGVLDGLEALGAFYGAVEQMRQD